MFAETQTYPDSYREKINWLTHPESSSGQVMTIKKKSTYEKSP